jgi:precorrin-6B methylase 2
MDAEKLFEMGRQFQPTCVLLAAAELEIFELFRDDAKLSAAQLASEIGSDFRATTILLDALAALGILRKEKETYSLPPALSQSLLSDGKTSVLSMLQHQANCLRRWSELAWVVKNGTPPGRRSSLRGDKGDLQSFIGAMDNVSAPVARAVLQDLKLSSMQELLDLGGASGSWTIAWLNLYPRARAVLYDLPEVIPMAKERVGKTGLIERTEFVAGDFNSDPLPKGFDTVWLSAIVHQQSRRENTGLYQKIRASLHPGGRLLIRDIVMDDPHTEPPAGALFAVNMLVGTSSGGTFSLREFEEDLKAAGFKEVQQLRRDPGMHAVVCATA